MQIALQVPRITLPAPQRELGYTEAAQIALQVPWITLPARQRELGYTSAANIALQAAQIVRPASQIALSASQMEIGYSRTITLVNSTPSVFCVSTLKFFRWISASFFGGLETTLLCRRSLL